MIIQEVSTGGRIPIQIRLVEESDYKRITKKRYSFNWRLEKDNIVYKLTIKGEADILGLISVKYVDIEERLEIKLLAVAEENIGSGKQYDLIAGNLIAFSARLAIKRFGAMAAISLIPKTVIGQHYMDRYGFEQAGRSLFMEGKNLQNLLKEYKYD